MPDDERAVALADDLGGIFERLVLAYQDRLYGFAMRMRGSQPDAEEVAQGTFLRAYRALTGYPVERIRALAPRPWLYRIALNVVRNRARRWRPTLVPLDGAVGERVLPPGPGVVVRCATISDEMREGTGW